MHGVASVGGNIGPTARLGAALPGAPVIGFGVRVGLDSGGVRAAVCDGRRDLVGVPVVVGPRVACVEASVLSNQAPLRVGRALSVTRVIPGIGFAVAPGVRGHAVRIDGAIRLAFRVAARTGVLVSVIGNGGPVNGRPELRDGYLVGECWYRSNCSRQSCRCCRYSY